MSPVRVSAGVVRDEAAALAEARATMCDRDGRPDAARELRTLATMLRNQAAIDRREMGDGWINEPGNDEPTCTDPMLEEPE